MAVFTFPILQHTTTILVLVATLACFVGRLHIYLGSWLFNCFRTETQANPSRISPAYMFVMWFSGLRGGVAFALASVSYADDDFPIACGGLSREAAALNPQCDGRVSDSTAILQTTLIIAAFTIFVFGGAITDVAIAFDVLNPKGHVEPPEPPDDPSSGWGALNQLTLMPWLTFNDAPRAKENSPRFDAVAKQPRDVRTPGAGAPSASGPGLPTSDIKKSIGKEGIEMALRGVASEADASVEDKLDEMRIALPSYTSTQLKKLLTEADGNLQQAIIAGQGRGFV